MLRFVLHHRVVMVNLVHANKFAAIAEELHINWHELTRNSTHLVAVMCDADAALMQLHNEKYKLLPEAKT